MSITWDKSISQGGRGGGRLLRALVLLFSGGASYLGVLPRRGSPIAPASSYIHLLVLLLLLHIDAENNSNATPSSVRCHN